MAEEKKKMPKPPKSRRFPRRTQATCYVQGGLLSGIMAKDIRFTSRSDTPRLDAERERLVVLLIPT